MKTIAVDIDDVLAANAEGFAQFSNKRWGTKLTADDYTEHWAEMWGVDSNETIKRREIILKERLFLKHSFFDEAKIALKKLSQKYRLVIVSSRGPRIQSDTIDWIEESFPGLFASFYFLNVWDKKIPISEQLKATKASLCVEAGAYYLIDDQPKHCLAAAEVGVKTVLFGDYKWNWDVKLKPNMARARSWQEVLEYFDAESRRPV